LHNFEDTFVTQEIRIVHLQAIIISKARECANMQYHQTICAVKLHSRALAAFQTLEKHKSKENLFELHV